MTFWKEEEDLIVIALYPHEKSERIADLLGRTVRMIYNRANWFGLKKSAEFLATPASGRTNGRQGIGYRFKKGRPAWNKGMKGLQIGGEATRFKPGTMPHNTHPVGSYRITKDGTLQRKISNSKGSNSARWRGVHELVWIEANGPVPPKHIVVFKHGMRTQELEQITLDRVECISLADNMRRNTLHRYPKEIAKAIQLMGALNRQLNQRSQK